MDAFALVVIEIMLAQQHLVAEHFAANLAHLFVHLVLVVEVFAERWLVVERFGTVFALVDLAGVRMLDGDVVFVVSDRLVVLAADFCKESSQFRSVCVETRAHYSPHTAGVMSGVNIARPLFFSDSWNIL